MRIIDFWLRRTHTILPKRFQTFVHRKITGSFVSFFVYRFFGSVEACDGNWCESTGKKMMDDCCGMTKRHRKYAHFEIVWRYIKDKWTEGECFGCFFSSSVMERFFSGVFQITKNLLLIWRYNWLTPEPEPEPEWNVITQMLFGKLKCNEKKREYPHTHTWIWPNGNWIWYSNEVQLPDCIMWSLGILRSFRTETFRVNVFERDAVSKPKYTLSKTVRNNVSRDTKRTLTERLCKHPNPNGWKAKKAHTSCINLFNKNDSMFYSNEMWCNSLYANYGWHVLNRHRKSVLAHFGGVISVVSEILHAIS